MKATSYTGIGDDWRKTEHEVTRAMEVAGGLVLNAGSRDADLRRVTLTFGLDTRTYSLQFSVGDAKALKEQLAAAILQCGAELAE